MKGPDISNDYQRVSLVTRFICAKCGNQLRLSYTNPEKVILDKLSREPQGAYAREEIITIHPCENCEKPIRDFKKALATINYIVQESEK